MDSLFKMKNKGCYVRTVKKAAGHASKSLVASGFAKERCQTRVEITAK